MLKFMQQLFEQISSPYFWENGNVMIVTCAIISVIALVVLWKVTDGFMQAGYKKWILVFVCVPVILFNFIMLFFPNGTGGVTSLFYLGCMIYTLYILMFTVIGEIVIIILRKLFEKQGKSGFEKTIKVLRMIAVLLSFGAAYYFLVIADSLTDELYEFAVIYLIIIAVAVFDFVICKKCGYRAGVFVLCFEIAALILWIIIFSKTNFNTDDEKINRITAYIIYGGIISSVMQIMAQLKNLYVQNKNNK